MRVECMSEESEWGLLRGGVTEGLRDWRELGVEMRMDTFAGHSDCARRDLG